MVSEKDKLNSLKIKYSHHLDKYSGDEKLACTGGAAPMYLCGMIKNQLPPHNTLHQSIDLTSPQ